MKGALLVVLGCLSLASAYGDIAAKHFEMDIHQFESDPAAVFAAWAAHNGKTVAAQDLQARLPIFVSNVAGQISRLGLKEGAMEVNGLADISREEFKQTHLGHVSKSLFTELGVGKHRKEPFRYENVPLPRAVDWRSKGIVGPVKNQHVNGSACGCCWAFATTGVTECIVAMYTGQPIALSEQQLIDCDRAGPWYDLGCDGGDFQGGIEYITENGGIDTEADYPYLAEDAKCEFKKEGKSPRDATLDGFMHVPARNETALAQAVSQHPVAVAVCCGDNIDNWHQYTGGIFEIPNTDIPGGCTDPLDHAVVVVGYDTTEEGQDYWLIKNSWSTTWGEQGFFKVRRNVGAPLAAFGLATQPGYPVKKGVNSKADPIRTDIWDSQAGSTQAVLVS
ncbi:hypothetical protein CVIRNUC_010463 [Coccomyxa viridis]|uniref:Peptidase C1A papain C-terminal domain-containing protein n=1 Tax=Coccomyxa viridis TaxID=1274662 RepID=A0AAV1IIU7_9CHLO|nr:hypothetical protein CVIRNUC_010463 [Coccomyxa viridis]